MSNKNHTEKVKLVDNNGTILSLSSFGELKTDFDKTAFGELRVAEISPVFQLSFIYNVNSDYITSTTTGSGAVSHSNIMANLSTTANINSSASINSKQVLKYRGGEGSLFRGVCLFTSGVASSSQIFGVGDASNGFFFGYNGNQFGVLRRSNGSDNWTAQSSWNGDTMDGNGISGLTLDPTKLNIYIIKFQWLGAGVVDFLIESGEAEYIPVHRIKYPNTATVPHIYQPNLPFLAKVENTSNNTDIVLKTSSIGGFIEGKNEMLAPPKAITNSKIGVSSSTETNILTIKSNSTFQSIDNRVVCFPVQISVSCEGTKTSVFRVIKNTTLGGSPSYTNINANTSTISYDTAGTTISGGTILAVYTLGKSDGFTADIRHLHIELYKNDTLTISVESSGATDASVGITWLEDF